MLELYTGVIFECAIPEKNANDVIKEIEVYVSKYLDCSIHVQLNKSVTDTVDISVKAGDYFLHFATNGLRAEWTEEKIEYVRKTIENMLGCRVRVSRYGPWKLVIDGKEHEV